MEPERIRGIRWLDKRGSSNMKTKQNFSANLRDWNKDDERRTKSDRVGVGRLRSQCRPYMGGVPRTTRRRILRERGLE